MHDTLHDISSKHMKHQKKEEEERRKQTNGIFQNRNLRMTYKKQMFAKHPTKAYIARQTHIVHRK
jgi:hypothetical protein